MQEKTVPVDSDFEYVLGKAIRYTLSREPYASGTICKYVEGLLPYLSTQLLEDINSNLMTYEEYGYHASKASEKRWGIMRKALSEELERRHAG